MTRVHKKSAAKRKHVTFHRNWKYILKRRESKIQHELRNGFSANFIHSESHNDEFHTEQSFEYKLKFWAVTFGIAMRAVDDLLDLLRASGHESLPKSYRTLLGTPRRIELANYGDNKYWYRGIADNLRVVFANLSQDLDVYLKFNVDGLPIFNSSAFQFWPILAAIRGEFYLFNV